MKNPKTSFSIEADASDGMIQLMIGDTIVSSYAVPAGKTKLIRIEIIDP